MFILSRSGLMTAAKRDIYAQFRLIRRRSFDRNSGLKLRGGVVYNAPPRPAALYGSSKKYICEWCRNMQKSSRMTFFLGICLVSHFRIPRNGFSLHSLSALGGGVSFFIHAAKERERNEMRTREASECLSA